MCRPSIADKLSPPESPRSNLPGSYATLPIRLSLFVPLFGLTYPLLLFASTLRALYVRFAIGKPSKVLSRGTYGNAHQADLHYNSQMLFDKPLEDEERLREALVNLCSENGIAQHEIDLVFVNEEPNPAWPPIQSVPMNYFRSMPAGTGYADYWEAKHSKGKYKMRVHVFNGQPGNPTVALYAGSAKGWDGSSNFNFCKELMNRYVGGRDYSEKKVFAEPVISADAAAKVDQKSFGFFMIKMPYNVGRSLGGMMWNIIRSFQWAGGNGFGAKMTMMNFSTEESSKLYNGAKALGVSPFACFTYAAHKACKEVLRQAPTCMVQQASLQTRHFPVQDQGNSRDFVGDWLVGPIQYFPPEYTLRDAQDGYKELQNELQTIGPYTQDSFMAKAYGLVNSGAAVFQCLPTFNDDAHVLDRCIFMNNYGVRTMPEEVGFRAWNWNAPLWLGLNTINVNGRTSTLIGSMVWGLPIVECFRDNVEATLREIMDHAPTDGVSDIPTYQSEQFER